MFLVVWRLMIKNIKGMPEKYIMKKSSVTL